MIFPYEKIRAGDATGMSAFAITETAEVITFKTKCIGKVYALVLLIPMNEYIE